VNAGHDVAEAVMDETMLCDPGHAGETGRGHADAKMRLPTVTPTGVASMLFAFVDDLQPGRL
jgi:hypothetical protein